MREVSGLVVKVSWPKKRNAMFSLLAIRLPTIAAQVDADVVAGGVAVAVVEQQHRGRQRKHHHAHRRLRRRHQPRAAGRRAAAGGRAAASRTAGRRGPAPHQEEVPARGWVRCRAPPDCSAGAAGWPGSRHRSSATQTRRWATVSTSAAAQTSSASTGCRPSSVARRRARTSPARVRS